MASKELGQIHSVKYQRSGLTAADANSFILQMDLAGDLTTQLQRMVRQGNYFKVVGIDIGLANTPGGTGGDGSVSGYFRYYTPTKGRCAAYRYAFKSMADQMKTQGIVMRTNHQYDFRVELTGDPSVPGSFDNLATLDGTNGLALYNYTNPGASVFDVYNASVQPNNETTPSASLFAEGFDTKLAAGTDKTDFVLNDTDLYKGNEDMAGRNYETIPFQIAFSSTGTTTTFQWRPDPALFLAVMCGLFEVYVEDIETSLGSQIELDFNVMVAGWKSIMGNPDKKRSRRKKKKA